jgi:DNA polymerase-1
MLPSPSVEVGASFECQPYIHIQEASQLERVLPDLQAAKTLGLDTETTGLNPRVDTLRLIQLATSDHTYIIDSGTVPVEMLAPLMTGDRWLIGQNIKFDLQFLVHAGLPWPDASVRVLDTMLCAQVLEIAGEHSLEALAFRYLDISLDKSLQESDWSGSLSPEQLTYAATDAQILLPLAKVLRERLQAHHLWPTARLESACAAPLAWLESAGMPVDVERWKVETAQLLLRAQDLRRQLSEMTGTSINWNSGKQLIPVLKAQGIEVDKTKREVLIPYVGHDLVATLLAYKQVSKAASTYGEKWLTKVDPRTNRVHGEFHALGTAVGRMTCTKPNLQQIPRDPAYRQRFRALPGRCLVKGDYSQQHLRIVAVIAPEPAMQQAYAQGKDLHVVTAARFQQIHEAAVTKEQRQHAKVFNFGLLYGMGSDKLQQEAWEKYGVRLSPEQALAQRQQ